MFWTRASTGTMKRESTKKVVDAIHQVLQGNIIKTVQT